MYVVVQYRHMTGLGMISFDLEIVPTYKNVEPCGVDEWTRSVDGEAVSE